MPTSYYVYAYLRNVDSTPYYIGKGKGNRAFRRNDHSVSVPLRKEQILFLQKDLDEEQAFEYEKFYIKMFGRKDLNNGILLNKTDGGEGGATYGFKGKEHSINTRELMSSSHTKRWNKTDKKNYKEKFSGSGNPMFGKKHSEETKLKISKAMKKKQNAYL